MESVYTYKKDEETAQAMVDSECYNLIDSMSKLSQAYSVNCHDQMEKHTAKALRGLLFTLGGAVAGGLYALYHHGAAQYYSGAEDVYRKYSDLIEDCDSLEDEWRDLDPATRENIKRFRK